MPYGKVTPYLPVKDLLKSYFKIQDQADHREVRERVIGKLLALDETLKNTLPVFLGLFNVPVQDSGWQAVDPVQRRHRILQAVTDLLIRERQVQPPAVVLENLHSLSTENQTFPGTLLPTPPPRPLLA